MGPGIVGKRRRCHSRLRIEKSKEVLIVCHCDEMTGKSIAIAYRNN